MSSFLRKLQTTETCPITDDFNIYQNGTYVITDQQNIAINATGNVYLNFTSVGNYSYLISPQNVTSEQYIMVYGFNSDIISNNVSCSSTTDQNIQADYLIAAVAQLVIDLVNFGIQSFPYIVFVPADPSPISESEVKTIIQLDNGQLLTLFNVSQNSLTSENFIFADSDSINNNNDNNDDNEDLYIGLGAGIGGGLAVISILGYMYVKGIGIFGESINLQV